MNPTHAYGKAPTPIEDGLGRSGTSSELILYVDYLVGLGIQSGFGSHSTENIRVTCYLNVSLVQEFKVNSVAIPTQNIWFYRLLQFISIWIIQSGFGRHLTHSI